MMLGRLLLIWKLSILSSVSIVTGVESKFYSEGALGELNPTLKTVLDILKGISSVRGR